MQRTLVLFVRAPRLGAGKRRLAREIGAVAALRFERIMVARLLRRFASDRRWRLRLAVTPDKARHRAQFWSGQIASVGQGGGDLGMRMCRALRACPSGPAVLVGTDIPALAVRHVWAAFRLLGSHDLSFGPAEDGGFWLVGPHALADTLAALPRRMTVGFAERLEDVDDADAYRRLMPRRGF